MIDNAKLQKIVDMLDPEQLRHLSAMVDARKLAAPVALFRYGDLIKFANKQGAEVTARVEKVNPKSLGCTETAAPFKKWRVGPSLARLVGSGPPVVAFTSRPASATYSPSFTDAMPDHAGSF